MMNRRALISVYHRRDSRIRSEFSRWVELLSTGGTARLMRESGLKARMFQRQQDTQNVDGRVKTLHPAVHSGLLARETTLMIWTCLKVLIRSNRLVCVNLYPFEETASRKPPVSDSELIEMIDIGGPTMIRSAAKTIKMS